ncbi:hypothetical protein [Gluconobacter cerinus]|uniref:hypothetical protein n=1 Tax=Gluconobacter cerinus TaxID=38307 RepID=UPI001B8C296A|nr:hypothetical protein [Gluconobacter cerinus]MBS1038993.1 hypothetical protein [Gluconobacter cerinus]
MKRTELSGGVRERLVRLPAPYEHHYGVLPLPLGGFEKPSGFEGAFVIPFPPS